MMGTIYGLYCVCSECSEIEIRYVGQSINFARRFERHLRDAPNHSLPVGRWIVKHGRDNIRYSILEEIPNEQLNEREVHWISELNTFLGENPRGLNCTTGGDSGGTGIARPESVKSQIAATLTGRTRDPAIAVKIRKTRHDREHQDGPTPRTTCIYCYPDGRPPRKNASHVRFHKPDGYWVENCPECDEDFREDKPSKKEYQSKQYGPKVAFGFGTNKATHNRWHVNRGVSNPDCPYCQDPESD